MFPSECVIFREKDMCWLQIFEEFNSRSSVSYRSLETLKEKYSNLKKNATTKSASMKRSVKRTGGGRGDKVVLTEMDHEILLMLGTRATGRLSNYDDDQESECKFVLI